ncbi:MAG: C40 family peptidase [Flavobacteriales bacterium]|nr:C40 family peptidase [Flavobacteriales bacterium]
MKRFVLYMLPVLLIVSCKPKHDVVDVPVTDPKEQVIQSKYAELLRVSPTEITNIPLYAFIDDWMGTKYKYGGLSKSGVDCSGFCNILYNEVYKKELPRTTGEISAQIKKVNKDQLEEGHLVVFNIANKKNSHVGVYLKNNMFIHASTSSGVIISSLDNPYYVKAYSKGGEL